jgi:hypothetical protein
MTDTGLTGLFENLKTSEQHDALASRFRKRMEASEQDDREKRRDHSQVATFVSAFHFRFNDTFDKIQKVVVT